MKGLMLKDKNCQLGIRLFVSLLVFKTAFLAMFFSFLPPEVPLFYSRPWGEAQLTTPGFLWLLPLGVAAIGFFNFYIAGALFEKFPFLSRVLVWSSLLISLLSAITVSKIIILVV